MEKLNNKPLNGGKTTGALNALKHGLCSQFIVLPGESMDEYQKLSDDLNRDFSPKTTIETKLVDRIAGLLWRLERCEKIESAMVRYQYLANKEMEYQNEANRYVKLVDPLEHLQLVKPHDEIVDESKHQNALSQVARFRKLQRGPETVLGKTFSSAQEAFLNLIRYEIGIERSLYRTLYELERQQAVRKGQSSSSVDDSQKS